MARYKPWSITLYWLSLFFSQSQTCVWLYVLEGKQRRNNLGEPISEILFVHLLSQSTNKLRVIAFILFVPFGVLAQQNKQKCWSFRFLRSL